MFKSCSVCGRVHDINKQCPRITIYTGGEERKLRQQRKWTEKSIEIRERANHLCEVCRAEGIYTYKNIEVHHIEKLSERKDLLLDNYNLVCLCEEHHKQADRGEISKEYLKSLAEGREG